MKIKRKKNKKKRIQAVKKWQAEDENVIKVQKEKQEEMLKNYAMKRMRDKIRDQNAIIEANKKNFQIHKKEELSKERQLKADEYRQNKHELAIKKRDKAIALDFQKHAAINDFREMMRKGGEIDMDALAKKYDIDIESLRKRVNEGRKGNRNQSQNLNSSAAEDELNSSPDQQENQANQDQDNNENQDDQENNDDQDNNENNDDQDNNENNNDDQENNVDVDDKEKMVGTMENVVNSIVDSIAGDTKDDDDVKEKDDSQPKTETE